MKNTRVRKLYLFFSSVMIFIIHVPFSFAKTKPREVKAEIINRGASAGKIGRNAKSSIYDSLKLSILGLSQNAFDYAVDGLDNLKKAGKVANDQLISIVDFTKSSAQKRLFVIDLQNQKLLFNTYVAHGQKSGAEFADRFSNIPDSYQSSLGFYETSQTYNGKNGYSMHLNGLEDGINNNAEHRAIVMHGAPYVSENFIKARGYIGRSWGCPAVPEELSKEIINKIKNGTCLFLYSENKSYLNHSKILHS